MRNYRCPCLICRAEKGLIQGFSYQGGKEFREITKPSSVLASFPSPLDLVSALNRQGKEAHLDPTPDDILLALLRFRSAPNSNGQLVPSILTLAFVPALHRLSRELSVWFPTLARQDIAQQILATFLELARSPAITSRKGYLSFAIVRELRRVMFRWAIRESRNTVSSDQSDEPSPGSAAPVSQEASESSVLLRDFLTRCRESGILSASDLEFLTTLKLEGYEAKEILRFTGARSPKAVHNRYQRIMKRLREAASKRRASRSETPASSDSTVSQD